MKIVFEAYGEGYLIAQTFEEAIWTPTTEEALCTKALIEGVQMGLSHKRRQLASELKSSLSGEGYSFSSCWSMASHRPQIYHVLLLLLLVTLQKIESGNLLLKTPHD